MLQSGIRVLRMTYLLYKSKLLITRLMKVALPESPLLLILVFKMDSFELSNL